MARLRTFIAVGLDNAVHDDIVALQETLARTGADVKWVEPDNIHLTLLFLGEVDDRDIIEVCRAVASCCAERSAFALEVKTVGAFPNLRRPRTLWVGVGDGTQELIALHDALEQTLLDLGCYRHEERAYTPHITLGRSPSERTDDRLVQAMTRQLAWHGGQTQVREVLVMSSQLTSRGPTYSVLSRAPLKAEETAT